MALPFDPHSVLGFEIVGPMNGTTIEAVRVVFKDHSSIVLQGDQLTEEVRSFVIGRNDQSNYLQ